MCNLSQGILEQGIEQGIKQGISQGRKLERNDLLAELVKDGILTIQEAAKRAGISESQFKLLL